MDIIKEIYGYVQTKDGGVYSLEGEEFIVIKPGEYDSDEHEDETKFSVHPFISYENPDNIISISLPNEPRDIESYWLVEFNNGTSHTYHGLEEVLNFVKLYQMIEETLDN